MTISAPTAPPVTERKAHGRGVNVRVRQGHTESLVPDDYSELFEHYYGYVVRLVSSNGIYADSAEDVAMTILMHFYRRDALDFYDPEFKTNHGDVERGAKFSTFLSGFVLTYLKHHLVMQAKKNQRESLSLDAQVSSGQEDSETWMTVLGTVSQLNTDRLDYDDAVSTIKRRLAKVEPRSASDRFNALDFFEVVRAQVSDTGNYNTKELAAHFQVAPSTVQNWLKRLREELA